MPRERHFNLTLCVTAGVESEALFAAATRVAQTHAANSNPKAVFLERLNIMTAFNLIMTVEEYPIYSFHIGG
jgi:hypothetical protein